MIIAEVALAVKYKNMKDSIKEIIIGNHLNKMFKMFLVARQILKVKAYIKIINQCLHFFGS